MATESPKLSLWTIENALVELIQAREEVEAAMYGSSSVPGDENGERAQELIEIDRAIREYVRAEVGKVDNIRGFLKHAEMMRDAAAEEAKAQLKRAQAWGRRIDRVKQMVFDVMQESGQKRLNGEKGAFLVKGNGGLQPLIVTDEAAVPRACVKYEGWIGGELWGRIMELLPLISRRFGAPFACDYRMTRVVDNERTRDVLKSACSGCAGNGIIPDETCPICGGSGTEPVPGARLGERGQHLEVR